MSFRAEENIPPEELSRRISEIDLTNLRRRADTENGNPPRYSQAELLKLRPIEKNGGHAATEEIVDIVDGTETPIAIPAPPPPTPNVRIASPDDITRAIQEPAEPIKKKNKKSSGKNKKATPTGFEGQNLENPLR